MGRDVIEFEVDTSPLRRAADVLEDAGAELVADAAEQIIRDAGQVAERAVRSRAGRHRVTGAMAARIEGTIGGDGVRAEARVRADDRIAALIIRGTRPHSIAARGGALRLSGPVRRFAHRVEHPGTPPDPFVAEAFAETIDAAVDIIDDAGDGLAAELAAELSRRA